MDTRDEVLALFLDELGIDAAALGSFEGRKRLQKAIYLLQQAPFSWNFGFQYNLYIRGPYSPALAAAGYRLLEAEEEWQQVRSARSLKEECRSDIEELRRQFASGQDAMDADLLEIAATLHFLVGYTYRYLEQSGERLAAARAWIQESKPALANQLPQAENSLRHLEMLS